MKQSTPNKRDAFRMRPEEFETGAGIVVNRSVIPAKLVDYSIGGCALSIKRRIKKLKIGDEIKVATSKGQYLGVVRRIQPEQKGMNVGIQFSSTLDKKFKAQNSFHLLGFAGKHTGGASFGLGLIIVTITVLYFVFAK